MNVRNVGSHGSVDRSGDRGSKADPSRPVVIPSVARDHASISAASRAAAAAVAGLAERARTAGGDREALVAAAQQKLAAGELDQPGTAEAAARTLLDARFLGI
jgi:hypothetical protein